MPVNQSPESGRVDDFHDVNPPADPILMGFRADRGEPTMLGPEWGYGWRVQSAVLTRTLDPEIAVWTAKLRESLQPESVGVVRPLRSSDGRYVLAGWRADAWVPGRSAPRFDEIAAASLRISQALHRATESDLGKASSPLPFTNRTIDELPWDSASLFRAADIAAFAEDPSDVIAPGLDVSAIASSTVARALELASSITSFRGELTSPNQVVHGDMVGTTIFDGSSPPVITDIVPAYHPAAWPVALTIVDGIAWGNADDALVHRWSHVDDFDELFVRAVLCRLFIHALHPQAQPEAIDGLSRVVEIVRSRVGATG